MYFPGLIEHIRVCRPRSGFSVVIRFATKSVLQNIHALVVVIHTPPLSNKRFEANLQRQSKKISNDQELIQSDPTSCPQNQKGNN